MGFPKTTSVVRVAARRPAYHVRVLTTVRSRGAREAVHAGRGMWSAVASSLGYTEPALEQADARTAVRTTRTPIFKNASPPPHL